MQMTVSETPVFQRHAAQVWSDAERDAFVEWISANPLAGDVIAGFTPLRKVRWGASGRGKRGGARVIYFNRMASGEIRLLAVYAKGEADSLSPAFLRALRQEFSHE